MRLNHPETRMTESFFHTLKDQGSRSLNPYNHSPLLYLKCWGSDYPYLLEVEQQKRWLPLVVTSASSTTFPWKNREGVNRVIDIARKARLK
jgi:hypothetical protein